MKLTLDAAPIERTLCRAGESAFLPSNEVELLQDGPAVFSSWLQEIREAKKTIFLENYIVNQDNIGMDIVNALMVKAKQGVQVYVLYDWLGCFGTSLSVWRALREAGAKVRPFNPWAWSNPLSATKRNHSKLLCIDGTIAFVGGLCIGDAWAGRPEKNIDPWRDTAVRIEGPAGASLHHAFAEAWAAGGSKLPPSVLPDVSQEIRATSHLPDRAHVQVVRGIPSRSRTYRILQTLFVGAESKIWITDAYFILPPPLYECLVSAARDGVDVRVLVPRHSDLPLVAWVGRSGYSALLAAGVRIFEWEGPMLHAKTAVVDGKFSKIGSSNMNLASMFTNWEADVIVQDADLAARMEEQFLLDLEQASELVLFQKWGRKTHIQRIHPMEEKERDEAEGEQPPPGGSTERKVNRRQRARIAVARAGAAVLGIALRRPFQRSNGSTLFLIAAVFGVLGGVGMWRPAWVGFVVSSLCLWFGTGFLFQAWNRWRQRGRVDLDNKSRNEWTESQ